MARAPRNVLVLPYRRQPDGALEFALFRRADSAEPFWQGVAGGVEADETFEAAAVRELLEEAGVATSVERLLALETVASVPRAVFAYQHWGPEVFVIQVRTFGVDIGAASITLSDEHREHRWLGAAAAQALVRHDVDRTALWELAARVESALPSADRR